MIQIPNKEQVLRIILIGLPFSGLEDVAKILNEQYQCKIFRINGSDQPQEMSLKKFTSKVCFQQFKQTLRAVLLAQNMHYTEQVLWQLKKRNFVNVVLVDASFKIRLNNFLTQDAREENVQSMRQFMDIDQKHHNDQYQKCLEFVRVRVMNFGGQQLKAQIKKKEASIIRYFRPSWDQYFMKIADIARRRSNCMKSSVGAVIVNDQNRVVSTGYNGTPKGIISCYKNGCGRCNHNQGAQLDQCLCLHAEQSAIIEVGIGATQGCRLYTTYFPCFSCAKIIKQAGIKRIYFMDDYEKKDSGKEFLKEYFANRLRCGKNQLRQFILLNMAIVASKHP